MRDLLIGAVAGLAFGTAVFLVVDRVGPQRAVPATATGAPLPKPEMSATAGLQPLSAEQTAKVLARPTPAAPAASGTKPAPAAPGANANSAPASAPAPSASTPAATPAAAAPALRRAAPGAAPAPAAAPAASTPAPAAAPVASTQAAPTQTAAAPSEAELIAQGEKVFTPCKACHTLEAGGPDRLGPNLHGLFGRKSGTKAGYKFSEAMTKAGIVWDEKQFDTYMANPKTFIPGNRMAFPGVPKPENRAALIAFLKQATK